MPLSRTSVMSHRSLLLGRPVDDRPAWAPRSPAPASDLSEGRLQVPDQTLGRPRRLPVAEVTVGPDDEDGPAPCRVLPGEIAVGVADLRPARLGRGKRRRGNEVDIHLAMGCR